MTPERRWCTQCPLVFPSEKLANEHVDATRHSWTWIEGYRFGLPRPPIFDRATP